MKNEMMETNQTGFLALQDFDLADVMCAEMDGLSAAFERVKIPSGGGVMFEIPGENPEEPDTVKTFSAVILYQHSLKPTTKANIRVAPIHRTAAVLTGIMGKEIPAAAVIPAR